jgi:Tol biopolymer transport system component
MRTEHESSLISRLTLGAAVVAFGLPLLPAGAQAAFPGKNGRIMFSDSTPREIKLYSINPDGTGLRLLTGPQGRPNEPHWSPDSRHIVFVRDAPGNNQQVRPYDLVRMDADGSNETILVEGTGIIISDPFYTPDGRIGFMAAGSRPTGTAQRQILLGDRNAQNRQPVLTIDPAGSNTLAYSPNGQSVAFAESITCESVQSCPNPFSVLSISRLEGSGVTRTTVPSSVPMDWSPDGRRLALVDWTEGTLSGGTLTINADGTGVTRLLQNGAVGAWSPNGRQIAFSRVGSQPRESSLYVANAEGGGERLVRRAARGHALAPESWGSAPPLVCRVPRLRNKPLRAAKRAIRRANCRVGKINRGRSSTIRRGRVISQRPRAGTRRPSGARVRLTVSRG